MGRQQNDLSAAALFQKRCGFFHGRRVHAGKRLVQQQGIAFGPKGAQQGGPTLLPAGKLPRRQGQGLRIVSDPLKIAHNFLFVFCFFLCQHQFHVLNGCQLRAEPILLEHGSDPAHPLHGAAVRVFQPHQDAQQGRLAPAAGGPEHCRTLHGQSQIFKQRFFSKAFCQAMKFQFVHFAASSPSTYATALSSNARNSFSNAALSRMMTKVQANSSPVERVILAR